jgi:hypothetical protein
LLKARREASKNYTAGYGEIPKKVKKGVKLIQLVEKIGWSRE